MSPLYSIGDIVSRIRLTNTDIVNAINKNCIIETENNRFICRKLMHQDNSNFFVLCAINPETVIRPANLYCLKIISAAPIIRIWRYINKL